LIGYMEACIVISEAHPLFHKDSASLEELLQHRVVTHHLRQSSSSTFAKTEQKLKQQGYNLSPALETDSLMVAMQAVKRGMALVASRSIGDLFLQIMAKKTESDNGTGINCDIMSFHPVKLLPIPKEVIELDEHNGRHPIHIFWHERFNNDLAHRWLREKIIHFMRESPWMHPPS
ncbi:MAG: LysR substrate-binding domain-containing protein, partial [Marinomonas sp.]